ncbi:phage holin family protein [Scardovia inopinata]|nr:phage holin family protein [Scardovia inopinata]
MRNFLVSWFIMTIACGITSWLLPGAYVVGGNKLLAYVAFALFMALINASIKPFLQMLALPASIMSFGITAILINVALLALASSLATGVFGVGLAFKSFWWALLGAFVISMISSILDAIMNYLV